MEIVDPVDGVHRESVARIWSTTPGEVVTAETLRAWSTLSPESVRQRRVALVDSVVAGFSAATIYGDTCLFRLVVDPPSRGRRIGEALLEGVCSFAVTNGATRLETYAADDQAERFALRRGFEVVHRSVLWMLEVARARLREASPVPIVSLATFGDARRAFEAARSFDENSPAWYSFDDFARNVGGHEPLQQLALDGDEIVGVALLDVTPGTRHASNNLTAVAPRWRGRGLAKALKSRQIEAARAAGIERIHTHNAEHNAPVLAVNAALGYERIAIRRELTKALQTANE